MSIHLLTIQIIEGAIAITAERVDIRGVYHPPLTQYFGGKNCNWCCCCCLLFETFSSLLSLKAKQHNNPNLFEDNLRYRNSMVLLFSS